MLHGKRILAVVPARSGSKGIPDKNLRQIAGISLIGHAGRTLQAAPFIDAKVISTDSPVYAEEAQQFGIDAPFLRPAELSSDQSGVIDALQHAISESERHYQISFDVLLIIEPTSPLRTPEDIERTTVHLIASGADSVVTVSPLSAQSHPNKILKISDAKLTFYTEQGRSIVNRQQLKDDLYYRNGICYALTRQCVMEQKKVITANTEAVIITRPVANIDSPLDLDWAAFLMARAKE